MLSAIVWYAILDEAEHDAPASKKSAESKDPTYVMDK